MTKTYCYDAKVMFDIRHQIIIDALFKMLLFFTILFPAASEGSPSFSLGFSVTPLLGFQSRKDHRTGAPFIRDRENEETVVYHTHCMTEQGAISYRKSSVDLWLMIVDSPLNWPFVAG